MKGLARFGNRWPSGARSTQPQPDGPGSGAEDFQRGGAGARRRAGVILCGSAPLRLICICESEVRGERFISIEKGVE